MAHSQHITNKAPPHGRNVSMNAYEHEHKLKKAANEHIITLENLYYDMYKQKEHIHQQKIAYNIIIRGVPEKKAKKYMS